MSSITIATYAVHVRKKRADAHLVLGRAEGHDIHTIVKESLDRLRLTSADDSQHQHLIRVTQLSSEGDDLFGVVEGGEYGYAAHGINVRTREVSFERKPLDAELIPLYYRFHLPKTSDTGILLLQRYGPHGVFLSLTDELRKGLATRSTDLTFSFPRLVPAEVLQDLLKGSLREIAITTYSIPDDVADKYRFLGNKRDVGSFTVAIKAKRKKVLRDPPWMKRLKDGRASVVALPENLGGSNGRVRIKVSYGGKTRMIDMSDPESVAPYIDATRHVRMLETGHPTFESIDVLARGLRDQLLEQLGKA